MVSLELFKFHTLDSNAQDVFKPEATHILCVSVMNFKRKKKKN